MDYASLAAQFGGSPVPPQQNQSTNQPNYASMAAQYGGSLNIPHVAQAQYGSSNSPSIPPAAQQGFQDPGSQFPDPYAAMGNWLKGQVPQMQQAEADENQTPGQKLWNMAGDIVGGVGNVVVGVGNVVGGAAKETWNLPGNIAASSQGEPEDTSGVDQAMQGINQSVGGVFQTISAPLDVSPVIKKGLSLPFEAAHDMLSTAVGNLGVDTTSDHGKAIVDSALNAILMASGGDAIKDFGVGKEGSLSLKDAWNSVKDTAKGLPDLGKGVVDAVKKAPEKVADVMTGKTAPERITQSRVEALTKIQENNTPIRKVIQAAEKKGVDVKTILSKTDLLKDSVDKDGTIRTADAQKELSESMKPKEDVIRKNLVKEGKTVKLSDVKARLQQAVKDSGVKGGALIRGLRDVDQDIEGYKLDADKDGNIPLADIHDAKVDKYSNIDYTNPESSKIGKTIANQLKSIVEENTKSVDVQILNKELQQHYAVQELLEKLDGKKVKGGRLGKYFAQIAGNVVGSALGPLGSIVGGEVGKAIQGANMSSTFGGETGAGLETSAAMKEAIKQGNTPNPHKPIPEKPAQLLLPEGRGPSAQSQAADVMQLPSRTQSSIDAAETARNSKPKASWAKPETVAKSGG